MPNGKPVNVKYGSLVIIWFALLTSQVLFYLVVWFVKPELFGGPDPVPVASDTPFFSQKPLIILAFAGSALVFFGLSLILSRQHMRRAVRDRDAGCLQTGLTLGCSLSEIPSILGVILALFFNYPYFYLWVALGTFGILLNFPRKTNLDAANSR
jgi:hypothetical protein